jgi:type IV secretory pathway protease TraF
MARTVPLYPLLIVGFSACAALLYAALRTGDVALYNGTPSMPVGVYLRTSAAIGPGAIVTVRAIEVAPDYAATRSFTKPGNRFLKRIAATTGDVVCAYGPNVWINGEALPERQIKDTSGLQLPTWSGCLTLSPGQVLLLGETQDSFDGRYWGPTPVSRIEGVWRRLGA